MLGFDESSFFHMIAVSSTWLVANSNQDFFLSATAFFSPLFHKGQTGLVLWTGAVDLSSSSTITIHTILLVASLINALIAHSLSLSGLRSLGRFAVVPCFFHFLMIDLMVVHGLFVFNLQYP